MSTTDKNINQDFRIFGSTNNTAVYALLIRNSDLSSLFSIRNDGRIDLAGFTMSGGSISGTSATFSGNIIVSGTVDGVDIASRDAALTIAQTAIGGNTSNIASTNAIAIAALPKSGGVMSGGIQMGTNKITGLGNPTAAQDGATKTYVDTAIGTIPAGLTFEGNWNASTDSPSLAGTTPANGIFYIVSTDGSTNLSGITDWKIGDWAVYVSNGSGTDAWQKVDNTSTLSGAGVSGQLAYWNGTTVLTGDPDATFDGTNLTIGGEVEAASLDINGNADISGSLTSGQLVASSSAIAAYFNGTGQSYVQGALAIQSSNADTPEARGQGVFMFNQGKDSTWYMGTRYQNADEWQVGRAAGTSIATISATTANAFLKINNAGAATFASSGTFSGNVTAVNSSFILNQGYSLNLGVSGYDIKAGSTSRMSFLTGGSEKVTIDSGGGVGIGTTSITDNSRLHIQGGHTSTRARMYYPGSQADRNAYIDMWASEPNITYNGSGIGSNILGSPYYGKRTVAQGMSYVRFLSGNVEIWTGPVTAAQANNSVKRLTVGTTAITTTLPLTGTTATFSGKITISDNQYLSWSTNSRIVANSSYMQFQVAATDKMRILANGNLGIGTTAPSRKLQVVGNSTASGISTGTSTSPNSAELTANGTNYAAYLLGHSFLSFGTNHLNVGTTAAEKMRITSAGNVLIGTTTASGRKLSIDGNAELLNSNELRFYNTGNTNWGQIKSPSSGVMEISTGGGVAMTLLGNGNVGVGTTSPGSLLHINKENATATFEIEGGLTTITAADQVHSEINFGANDASVTGGISGSIKSIADISNGAHNGLAFYTGQQSRTPYLQRAMQIRNTGGISFGSTASAYGSSGQILKSNGDASPTWVNASSVIGGPYLPLTGGTLSGDLQIDGGDLTIIKQNDAPTITLLHDGTNPSTNDLLFKMQFQSDYNGTHENWGKIEVDTNANQFRTNMDFYVKSTSGTEQLALRLEGQPSAIPNTFIYGLLTGTTATFSGNLTAGNGGNGKIYFGSTSHYLGNIGANVYLVTSGQAIFDIGGSEKMRLNSTGLGIGTTSMAAPLDVNTGSINGLNVDNTAAVFGNNVGTTQSRDTWIKMRASVQTTDRSWAFGSNQSGEFRFNYLGSRGTAPTSGTTKMIIKGLTGNVLLGTTNDSGITANVAALILGGSNTSVSGGIAYQVNGSAKAYHYVEANLLRHQVVSGVGQVFFANGGEKMRLDTGGKLLINATTSSFSDKFYINGDAYSTGGFRVGSSATFVGKIYNNSGKFTIESDSNRDIQFGDSNNNNILYIDTSTQNIGIGTATPQRELHIHASNHTDIQLTNDTTGVGAGDGSTISATSSDLYINNKEDGNLLFFTANSEKARITSAGNFGIGVSGPTTPLHVSGIVQVVGGGSTTFYGTDGAGSYARTFNTQSYTFRDSGGSIKATINTSSGSASFTGQIGATTGAFTGQVTIPATPTASTHAASKGYIDGLIAARPTQTEVNTNTANIATNATGVSRALPKAGGAMTGAITTNSTFDGRDVAADGVTADAALPKAGGEMTGNINMGGNTITGTGAITGATLNGELRGSIDSATSATTQSSSDNTTKVATTAYVTAAVSASAGSSVYGSFTPSATQTTNAGGNILTRVQIIFNTAQITASGVTVNSTGLSVNAAGLYQVSFNFASIVSGTKNRTMAGAELEYSTGGESWAVIPGTRVYNYDRGTGAGGTYGVSERNSANATFIQSMAVNSFIRARFWIEARTTVLSGITTEINGCRLSVHKIN